MKERTQSNVLLDKLKFINYILLDVLNVHYHNHCSRFKRALYHPVLVALAERL